MACAYLWGSEEVAAVSLGSTGPKDIYTPWILHQEAPSAPPSHCSIYQSLPSQIFNAVHICLRRSGSAVETRAICFSSVPVPAVGLCQPPNAVPRAIAGKFNSVLTVLTWRQFVGILDSPRVQSVPHAVSRCLWCASLKGRRRAEGPVASGPGREGE